MDIGIENISNEELLHIDGLVSEIVAFEEKISQTNNPDEIDRYENQSIHIERLLDQYIETSGRDRDGLIVYINSRYDEYKTRAAKNRLSLFRFKDKLRYEPGIWENVAKHLSRIPQKPSLNMEDTDDDMFDLNESDLQYSSDSMSGGKKTKNKKMKKKKMKTKKMKKMKKKKKKKKKMKTKNKKYY